MAMFNGLMFDAGGGGTGDFVGPASSTDNAVVVFDGTTGKLGKNSSVTISSGTVVAGAAGTGAAPAFKLPGGAAGLWDDWGTGGVAVSFVANTAFTLYSTSGGSATGRMYFDTTKMQLASAHQLCWGTIGGTSDVGLARGTAGYIDVTNGSTGVGNLRAGSLTVDDVYGGDATGGVWSTNSLSVYPGIIRLGSTYDVGVARNAAGVARITDASTGIGALLAASLVEANTAGSGTPNVLVATESRSVLTNEGTTAENYHTLPSAAAGLSFTFVVQDADGVRIVAATGDTIRPGTVAASATGGYIRCATQGAAVTLCAINATEWMATSLLGTWTVDA